MSTVVDLDTYDEQEFNLSPRDAVMAAYAQSKGDNGGDYERKYGRQVVLVNGNTWVLAQFISVDKNL